MQNTSKLNQMIIQTQNDKNAMSKTKHLLTLMQRRKYSKLAVKVTAEICLNWFFDDYQNIFTYVSRKVASFSLQALCVRERWKKNSLGNCY